MKRPRLAHASRVVRVMSKKPARTVTVLTLIAIAVLVPSVTAAADDSRLVVRVYDTAFSDPAMRATAIRVAAAIVEEAGIAVTWHDCTGNGAQPQCQDSRRTRNYIVRLMPTFVAGTGASTIAL